MCSGPYGSEEGFSLSKEWSQQKDSGSSDTSEGADLPIDNAPSHWQHSIQENPNEITDNTASEWLW